MPERWRREYSQQKYIKMLAYAFKGRRHDVGDKLGFLEATVEFALKRDDLRDDFLAYLENVVQKERK